jgi:hypothetical protein
MLDASALESCSSPLIGFSSTNRAGYGQSSGVLLVVGRYHAQQFDLPYLKAAVR